MVTYRHVADHVKQRARLRLNRMTAPEDDWPPELFLSDGIELQSTPIPPWWFENQETKSRLIRELLVPAIRNGGFRIVALSIVMFMLSNEHPVGQVILEREEQGWESPTEGLPYFQDVEGSVEQLWVQVFDAERHEGWYATITRPKRGRPRLAPFVLIGPDLLAGDYFIDPIKAALR